jgi:hypothetical protein
VEEESFARVDAKRAELLDSLVRVLHGLSGARRLAG